MARDESTFSTGDHELRELIVAMCNDTITKVELAQLEDRLERDEAARRFYLFQLAIHGNLVSRYRGPEVSAGRQWLLGDEGDHADIHDKAKWTVLPSAWKNARWILSVPLWAAAAVVLIALGTLVWMASRPDDPGPDIAKPVPDKHVPEKLPSGHKLTENNPPEAGGVMLATLHATGAVRWADTDSAIESGARIGVDRLVHIGDGVCEAVLNDGVRIVVEGPAQWKLTAQNALTLDSGKVYVDGPPGLSGFTVQTPNAKIVDLGTEFVVDAQEVGKTDVAVLSGVVDCFKLSDNETISDRTQVVAGETAMITPDAKTFVSLKPPEDVDCRQNLKMPEAIRARWRFEEAVPPPPGADLVPIRGAISDSSGHGHRLDYWAGGKGGIGQYPHSTEVPPASMFRKGESGGFRSFNCGALRPDKPGVLNSPTGHGRPEAIASGFTLEGFVKTDGDRFRSGNMVILFQGEKYISYMVSLNLPGPGNFHFGVFGAAKSGGRPGFVSSVTEETANFSDGRWYYFAARYTVSKDGKRNHVRLDVVDEKGRRYSSTVATPEGFKIATSNRPLLIGRERYFAGIESKSHFVGLIDEVRISNRPLRDDELLGKLPPPKRETAAREAL